MVTSINCCVDILLVEKNTVEEDSSEDILRIKIAPWRNWSKFDQSLSDQSL